MAFIDFLLYQFVRVLLRLRYRIRVSGFDDVAARGTRGIVFFPNHPALIDPIIVMSTLFYPFRPRVLADQDQVDRPFIRLLAKRVNVVPLPDIRRYGPAAKAQVEARVNEVYESLKRDGNMLMYPSGHLYRSRLEDLRGNSGVETILREVPQVRVVLIRTRGLWGSRFGMASGEPPRVATILKHGLWELLISFVFFAPKREVTLEFFEPDDLPRNADRNTLNAYLEKFYNEDAPPAMYVPRHLWDSGGVRELPEPAATEAGASLSEIPESVRQLVLSHLSTLTDGAELKPESRLSQDLGLDSLDRAELALWIGKEFGFNVSDVDAIQTVGDVLLAARGQAVVSKQVMLKPVPKAWFAPRSGDRVGSPTGETVNAAFLSAARKHPGRVAVADQMRGAMTYRDLVTAIFVLKPRIEKLAGERLGILLPASAGAAVAYLATIFSAKTPVQINWTTGSRNVLHGLQLTGVRHVLTSKLLIERLRGQGLEFPELADRWVFLEDLGAGISKVEKIRAALAARISWSALDRAKAPEHAAILFTSGSESLPKAVPLTHRNVLTNIRDTIGHLTIRDDDALIGLLPPFHSFGLTVTLLLPLVAGLRVVYHANPTEAWVITKLIEAYKPTFVLGTPTFLSGIVRAASGNQLDSIRIAVTGAEKCPERTYAAIAERCPRAVVVEGYGITECSPIVSANDEQKPVHGSIGRVLPSLEYVILDNDTNRPIPRPTAGQLEGRAGMLLVRGDSIFPGYIGDAPSPFVEFDGKPWYRTGDLVSEAADGVLTFRGRLKRFVKLGGEMISLPAIEAVLEPALAREGDEGPALAVDAIGHDDKLEIVLATTRPIDRAKVNELIRSAGLPPLYNVSRVIQVEAIPVLGTGKTDYRTLRTQIGG